ncbi:MAG: bacteriohemerythrin [Desulfuromonadales bacterium]|nr:bacteriohemerythrin [Desulfuromonadales bacterium]
MLQNNESQRPLCIQLARFRIVTILFLTAIIAGYLAIEISELPLQHGAVFYKSVHWAFAAGIWLTGLAAILFGFSKVAEASAAIVAERNNLIEIFDTVQTGLIVIDRELNVIQVNQAVCRQFDKTPGNCDGKRLGFILSCPKERNAPLGCGYSPDCESCGLMLSLRDCLIEGLSCTDKEAMLQCEVAGEIARRWIHYAVRPIEMNSKRFALLSLIDVSESKDAETLQHSRNESYRALVENVPDIIVRFDRSGRRLYANPAFECLIGVKSEPLIGKTILESQVLGEKISNQVHNTLQYVVDSGISKETEINLESVTNVESRFHLAHFVPEFDTNGEVSSVLLIARDITELRKYQEQLQHMAFYDPLTKLPNRALFTERLSRLIAERSRSEHEIAGVMILDLDEFKRVNDTLGHDAGDRLLCKVGERIRTCLREYDTVARLGGDEFAVLIPEVRREIDLAVIARKILYAVDAPFRIAGKELFVTTSIGIACYQTDSDIPSELLRFADTAMYHAKTMGRNNFQFYSESLTHHATDRMELETDLRKAQQQGELELYYQPKVNTITGLMVGAEALLRWRHPTRGMIPPNTFIGIAEDTGLIVGIGEWVVRTACFAATEYNWDVIYPVKVAVNLSVRQLVSGDFVHTVRSALADSGCRPEWLELEITESLLMSHSPLIMESLVALDEMGISIAIDDFGTGYSSLGYLTDFPISVIKIDKSFVDEIMSRQRNLELVKAIVSLGHALGFELVAEGVETGEQAACLDRLGCHIIQGYLYGRPMPAAEFEIWQNEFFLKRNAAGKRISELAHTQWRDYLTTGHDLIDAQHQELFKRITMLTQACRTDKGQSEISRLLDYLGEYVLTHFDAEEELLVTIGSSRYEEHKAAHNNFTEVVKMLISRFIEEGATFDLTVEINSVAVDWLTRHICTMDRDLASRISQFNGMVAAVSKE